MMYAVGVQEYWDKSKTYTMFETNTDSFFDTNIRDLKTLINKHKVDVINLSIIDGQIVVKQWYNQINNVKENIKTGAEYVLICKLKRDTFKLARYTSEIKFVDNANLRNLISEHKVANCRLENSKIQSIDNYTITENIQVEEYVSQKYALYLAKLALLGRKVSFVIIVEGNQVKLKRYYGPDKDVIVPNFITTIMAKAFLNCKLETITLNTGIKYIGYSAFDGCNLSEVEIPETVEFIGQGVFNNNHKLFNSHGEYRQDRVKILNKIAVVIDRQEGEIGYRTVELRCKINDISSRDKGVQK